MSEINYTNVSDLPVLEEATENTHVIVEDGGEFKRMSGDNLGGGGVKTAIIRDNKYLNALGGVEENADTLTLECLNMTFEEARQIMASGEPLVALLQVVAGYAMSVYAEITWVDDYYSVPCLVISQYANWYEDSIWVYWTADGLSSDSPSSSAPPV